MQYVIIINLYERVEILIFINTGDEIKDMESDTEWQFVTVGDQVTYFLFSCAVMSVIKVKKQCF